MIPTPESPDDCFFGLRLRHVPQHVVRDVNLLGSDYEIFVGVIGPIEFGANGDDKACCRRTVSYCALLF